MMFVRPSFGKSAMPRDDGARIRDIAAGGGDAGGVMSPRAG
jgi:hypothetical protein